MTGRSIRVLLVEDHRMFAELAADALERQPDITVVGTARNVAEAGVLARAAAPDVILMDVRLPDGTGIQAAQAILAEQPEVRVLLLTAQLDESVMKAALDLGCSGCVEKSSRGSADLVNGVRTAYAGDMVVPPAVLRRHMRMLGTGSRGNRYGLTAREVEVLSLLAEGQSTGGIGDAMGISHTTVRNHTQAVIRKMGVHSKLEAVTAAIRDGLILPPAPSRI